MAGRIPLVDYLVLEGDQPHLQAKACAKCDALYLDRRNACAKCGGTEFGTRALGTSGTVRAYTIVKRAAPGVPVPYVSAVVDLEGGGVVKANVVEVEPDPSKVALGMAVRMTTFTAATDDDGTEAIAFGFVPA